MKKTHYSRIVRISHTEDLIDKVYIYLLPLLHLNM